MHRIYTLFDEPVDYAMFGLDDKEERPWLLPLEVSMSILDSCTSAEPDPQYRVRRCLTKGVFDSSWAKTASHYFFTDIGTFKYKSSSEGFEARRPFSTGFISNMAFDISSFFTSMASNQLVTIDCFSLNYFNYVLCSSLGLEMFPRYIENDSGGHLQVENVFYAPGDVFKALDYFESHFVNAYETNNLFATKRYVWDSSLKYQGDYGYKYVLGEINEEDYILKISPTTSETNSLYVRIIYVR